ncbi:MAG TPA: LpqB family beta-propeller domain-containing protein, partial [Gemmatimonadales bacterium]|nr:LpqB family beta-propeller domain-containing protein [Gemmatimonadales bacterium]
MAQDLLEALREAIGGSYEIERELGGGMSRVFAATERALGRRVAIKLVPPELAGGVNSERFRREIQVAASLQHPHIVPLLHSGGSGDLLYYVMPLVEGTTLRARLKLETQLSVREAVQITRQVAGALDYAHRRGVVHRDIKPENILLQEGQALVTDFGIALAVHAAGGDRITETGFSIGTPQYMSPEQAAGERIVDARTDVYSLGAVLYEMLAGEPPVSGPTTPAIIARLMTEEPRPIHRSRSTIPAGLETATMRALAKLPADRFASAAELSAALDDPAFMVPTPRSTATTGLRYVRPWHKQIPVWAGVAVTLAALAAWGWLRPRAGGRSGEGSGGGGRVARFVMSFARGEEPRLSFYGTSFALSRDGSRVVYLAANQIMVRSRDQLRATPVPGTQSVYAPAFSPDGQSVAFVTGSPGALRVVSLAGGAPRTLVNDGVLVVHVLWSSDRYLYYTDVHGALVRVRETGGEPQVIARPDTA